MQYRSVLKILLRVDKTWKRILAIIENLRAVEKQQNSNPGEYQNWVHDMSSKYAPTAIQRHKWGSKNVVNIFSIVGKLTKRKALHHINKF